MNVIRTVVQHRDRFVRTGLAHVLEREPDIDVLGDVATAAELVTVCAHDRPDAVVLEIDTDQWDAPRLAAALRKRQRALRVIGLHDTLPGETARRVYQAGVRATVSYDTGTQALLGALRGRHLVGPVTWIDPPVVSARTSLTERELDVIKLIAAGLPTREIAAELGITLKTVENHKQRLFRKLDVQNQAHAVSIAIRQGLLAPSVLAQHA